MSKDPAVLFYTSDFMSGVVGLTMSERGQYISLLCTQHQQGHLSEKTICLLLGIASVSEIPDVMEKFKIDEDGKYYNERMELEAEKRHNFVESRKENAKLGGRPRKDKQKPSANHVDKHTDKRMGNVNENAIECETNDGFTEAIKHFKEHRNKIKKPMTDHAVDLLKKDLQRYAPDNVAAQIEMIDRAIMKGWQTVYPIDENPQPQKDGERRPSQFTPEQKKPPEQERRKFYYTDTDGKVKEGVR